MNKEIKTTGNYSKFGSKSSSIINHDWVLVPRIKISALKQHLKRICGMDSIEDIKKLNKLVDDLGEK